MRKLLPFLIFVLCYLGLTAQNPTRSGKDYAFLFYVTTFQDRGWESLPETRTELEAIAGELQDNYNFKTEIIPNPTRRQVLDKIAQVNQSIRPEDQVVFFFSTHGHFQKDTERGYLIPADGKSYDPYGASWISYDDLGSYVTLCPSKHVLLALDACYSGAFGFRWKGPPDELPWDKTGDCKTKISNALHWDSRLYFSSGSKEQRTPAQSKFASRWLEALRRGQEEGIVRSKDLRYYLSAIEYPKPEGGSFSGKHQEGGDFVFVHKNGCGSVTLVDKTADKNTWIEAQNANTLGAYQGYRSRFPNGEFIPLANKRITELEAAQQEEAAWENAKKINTTKTFDDFIRDYPNSIYKAMADYNRSQLETKKETYTPTKTTTDDLPDFVFVQGGFFQMGSKDGTPGYETPHSVTVSDFYIHKNELTVEEFSKFISATNYKTDADKGNGSYIWTDSTWEKKSDINWKCDATGKVRSSSEYNHPVIHVSWNDAVAYCNWRSEQDGLQKVYSISGSTVNANWAANGYRLPTEAEWEFAARSRGKNEKWAGTSSESSLSNYANHWESGNSDKDGYEYTAPVGSFRPNALGLYDMSGNVSEWCWDWFGSYPSSSETNPRGPDSGPIRVLRGGSWQSKPANLRCAHRYSNFFPVNMSIDYGFRLARTAS